MQDSIQVTIIFSTRSRADLLEATLSNLARQQFESTSWEIIVVDNGSTDSTPSVLEQFATRLPLTCLREPEPGKNRALNRAIDAARGELLVFTDDDIVPDERWMLSLWEASQRWPEHSIFAGPVEPVFPMNTPDWVRSPDFQFGGPAFARFCPNVPEGLCAETPVGPNLAIRAEVFRHFRYNERVGPAGKNYAMGSEAELLWRLRDAGYCFIFVPDATVGHVVRADQITPEWLYGRAFRYGRGCARRRPRNEKLILGVPRQYWRRIAIASIRTAITRCCFGTAKYHESIEFYRLCGIIREYRTMMSEVDADRPTETMSLLAPNGAES